MKTAGLFLSFLIVIQLILSSANTLTESEQPIASETDIIHYSNYNSDLLKQKFRVLSESDEPSGHAENDSENNSNHGENEGENHEEEHGDDHGDEHGDDHGDDHGDEHGDEHGDDHEEDHGEDHAQKDEHLEEVDQPLEINDNSDDELERNYRKIAEEMEIYENAYKQCISNIKDMDYKTETLIECVGERYNLFLDDVAYLRRKLLSKTETTVRARFIEHCYQKADDDLSISDGCDILERDALVLVWHEIDFPLILNHNKLKYTNLYSHLPDELFDGVISNLRSVYSELNTLMDELYDHQLLSLTNIKNHADLKTSIVRNKLYNGDINEKPKIKKTKILITSTLHQKPHYYLNLDHFPRPVVQNGNPEMYMIKSNPYVQQWANNVGPKRFSEVNTPNVQATNWGYKPKFEYDHDLLKKE